MYVGKKIRALRLNLDMTQGEIADSLNITQSYYSSIERGKKKISDKLKNEILKKYNLNEDYFVGVEFINNGGKLDSIVGGNDVGGNVGGKPNKVELSDEIKKKIASYNPTVQLLLEYIQTFSAKNNDYKALSDSIFLTRNFENLALENIHQLNEKIIKPQSWEYHKEPKYEDFEKHAIIQINKLQRVIKTMEKIKKLYAFISLEVLTMKNVLPQMDEIGIKEFIKLSSSKDFNEAKNNYFDNIEPLL